MHPWSLSQLDAARMADTYRYESYKNGFPILCASDYCAAAAATAAAAAAALSTSVYLVVFQLVKLQACPQF